MGSPKISFAPLSFTFLLATSASEKWMVCFLCMSVELPVFFFVVSVINVSFLEWNTEKTDRLLLTLIVSMNTKKYNDNQTSLFAFPNIPVGEVKCDQFGRRAGIFCGNLWFPGRTIEKRSPG